MPRAYFIGGAPRVGKSTLAKLVLERHPMTFVATDDLRTTLRLTTTPEETPDLFYLDSLNANEPDMARRMLEDTQAIIQAADRESAAVWPAMAAFAQAELAAGRDVLIEGVAILPAKLTHFTSPYSAIFLGNQSDGHAAIIHDYARNHPASWLGRLAPHTLDAFAHFTRAKSHHTEIESKRNNYHYLEMSAKPFPEAIESALHIITLMV